MQNYNKASDQSMQCSTVDIEKGCIDNEKSKQQLQQVATLNNVENECNNNNLNQCINSNDITNKLTKSTTSAPVTSSSSVTTTSFSTIKPTLNTTPSSITTTTTTTIPFTAATKAAVILKKQSSISCRVVITLASIVIVTILIILLFVLMGWTWYYGFPAVLIAITAILIASRGWHWFYIAAVTGPRDLKALIRYIKILLVVNRYQKKNVSIADVFLKYVIAHPEKPCFIFEEKKWSFQEVNEYSNRIANLFHQHGFKSGDIVGLYLENRPEFVCIWLGLSKIGCVVPLINTNLRDQSLLHSITVANCKGFIFGETLMTAIKDINDKLSVLNITLYQLNDGLMGKEVYNNCKNLTLLLESASKENYIGVDEEKHHKNLLYIYTSGTTGLPKAAVITHSRYMFMAIGIHYVAQFQSDDIFYTPLPLYHTAGGIMSIGQALLFGSTVVIRKKFSASGYFSDCKKYGCTVSQYIGEMCRYILATKESSTDKDHNIRIIFGNGLRPQIWPQFVQRFGIKNVNEFYGATEGNANIVNVDNTVGAIGFVSRIIPSLYPISIIRADQNTGEPIRDSNGLCQVCPPNEPGVFIGKIKPNNPSRAFLGYVDKSASSKKIVRDVFKKGDSAFLSGDILIADEYGNLFFKDRTGDTFRWKGENVSTSEIEAQISNLAGYRDAVVYGVEIPHLEGRAGMAAILDTDKTLDLNELAKNVTKVLPTYARPQFIRLLSTVDMTGTFKLKKLELQKEAFNPNIISDRLYYLAASGSYETLDTNIYEQICRAEIRF